jgi:flagellar protein FlaJ
MNFLKFWPQRKSRSSFNEGPLSFDLLYQLSYMSAISAAGLPRSQIFELGSQLPCSAANYIAEIQNLSQKWRYDYAVACRMVGESSKKDAVKSLLLRLASSLNSGEPEVTFLDQEARIQAEAFNSDYERRVESLRKWTEAYAALVVSAALIVMVAAVSMLIYPIAAGFTIALACVTIITGVVGAWFVYSASPKEVRVHSPTQYCPAFIRVRRWERVLVPAASVTLVLTLAAGAGLGLSILTASILLIPIGIFGTLSEHQVSNKDRDIHTFLRSLGNVASAIGITTSQAVTRLDLRSTAALAEDVKRLRSRLASRLKPDLCWQRFSLETGSELIYRSIRMFHDATRLGGEADVVGERSSLLAMSLDFLRAKRGQVSSSFTWLAIGVHGAIVALLVFVSQVVTAFAGVVEGVYEEAVAEAPVKTVEIFSFSFQSVPMLKNLTLPCLLVLAATTAFAANAAVGGSRYKLYLYLGLTFGLSGAAMLLVPAITDMIFASVSIM